MTYRIRELYNGKFGVFAVSGQGEVRVKVFATRKGAENWVSKR